MACSHGNSVYNLSVVLSVGIDKMVEMVELVGG